MRTTLKRGVGRSRRLDPRARVDPAPARQEVRLYRQPPPRRPRHRLVVRVAGHLAAALAAAVLGTVGGFYLWLHESIAAVRAHSPDVVRAEHQLGPVLPGKPAIALVLGDNRRAGFEAYAGGRSDTIMLVRADPTTRTISLLSLPRDLRVPIYCPGNPLPRTTDRIDYAFAWCGAAGSLDTVRQLTGLRINYLITIDFHGFKEIVNDLGGVWLDVDRRYYNRNVGTAATDYSNIDLQPGYQLLSGGSALEFVRFRHTDSDFYRQARQQEFIRALKDQLAQHFDPLEVPPLVSAITHNVEVGSKIPLDDSTVLGYALFALTLPRGHILQNYVGGTSNVVVGGADELQAAPDSIAQAVQAFSNPAPQVASAASDATLARRPRRVAAPPPAKTTVTVLNGDGVAGAAATATALLDGQGYVTAPPPNGLAANAPTFDHTRTEIYFDAAHAGAQAAAAALQSKVGNADVAPLPAGGELRALDPGSSLVVVVGSTFPRSLAAPPAPAAAVQPAASVRTDPSAAGELLAPLAPRVPFTLEVPTVLESTSWPDTLPGDVPVRLYTIVGHHKAVRLVFRTGAGEFWGIEETDWTAAPVLAGRSFQRTLGGRTVQLYYAGTHLHMVVLQAGRTSTWVVNTLLDSLSNPTMLAIARGLEPLGRR